MCDAHYFKKKRKFMSQKGEKIIENWSKQIKKGTLELAILSYIEKNDEKAYGYDLIKSLTDEGIETDGNTVYPILRRLENNGLIMPTWSTKDNQPKKFYKITEAGQRVLNRMKKEWLKYNDKIKNFIKNEL